MIVGLFRTIAFLVLAWVIFRFLDRWMAARRMHNEQRQQGRPAPRRERKEQEIIINYDPRQTQSRVRDDVGEEVDFEEVEEK